MRKFLIITRNIFMGIIGLMLLFVVGVFIYNQVMLKKEEVYWKNPPGTMVEVDGHNMHVYTEGSGNHTIILLPGFGTASPYVDFLPMCQELAKDYKVVIIERFGYGLSDVVDGERSFETIVDQDRKALDKLGIKEPYVLCPHSISGIESLIWAQNYPEEVEAIIGMDMSDSSIKGDEEFHDGIFGVEGTGIRVLRAMGFLRFMADEAGSEEEKMIIAIGNRNFLNKTLLNEAKSVDAACDMIDNNPLPKVPTLQLVSNEAGDGWMASHQAIVDASSNGKLVELDCGHYVYVEEPERVVEEIRGFLEAM